MIDKQRPQPGTSRMPSAADIAQAFEDLAKEYRAEADRTDELARRWRARDYRHDAKEQP